MKSVLWILAGLLFAYSAAFADDRCANDISVNSGCFGGERVLLGAEREPRDQAIIVNDGGMIHGSTRNGRTTWRDEEGNISTSRTNSAGRTTITHGDGTQTTCRARSNGRVSCY